MADEWYREFFSGLALDVWRNAITPQETKLECDFLEAALAPDGPRALLDAPSGNGRHALELAARGHRVTGVDLAADFVAEARAKAGKLPVEFVLGDMRALPAGVFDGAYCLGNSFGYFDHAGTRDYLAALSRAVVPGGRLVLDTGTAAECVLPSLERRSDVQFGDVHMLALHDYDAAESVLVTDYTFTRGAETERRRARYHVYTAAEIARLLADSGFIIEDRWSSFARAPFALGSSMLILVAVRR